MLSGTVNQELIRVYEQRNQLLCAVAMDGVQPARRPAGKFLDVRVRE
jgi:hypothetical protein